MVTNLFAAMLVLAGAAEPVASPPAAGPFPEKFTELNAVADQESALIDRLRAFQVEQNAMIEWDKDLMARYASTGEQDLAEQKQAEMRQRIDDLEMLYRKTLELYPNNARAHTYFGEVLYDLKGEWPGALEAWKTAIALDDSYSVPHNNLGLHYWHTGQYEPGLKHIDTALKLDPKNPDYLYNLTQMYLTSPQEIQPRRGWDKEKVYHEAMKLSKTATELRPEDFELANDYAMNFFHGLAVFKAEIDWDKAIAAWQRVRELAPSPSEVYNAWLYEGRAWAQLENWPKAVTCYEKAVETWPRQDVGPELASRLLEEARQAMNQSNPPS